MKNKYKFSLPLLLIVLWLNPGPGNAIPITIGNGSPDGVTGWPSDFDFTPSPGQPKQIADDFTISAGTTLTSVEWWGIYFPNTLLIDNFTVRIFPDSGAPTSTTSIPLLTGILSRTDTGDNIGPFDIYNYTLTLASSITLSADTYWLSTVNNTAGSDIDWFWLTFDSSSGNAIGRLNDGDDWDIGISDEMAFNLHGDVTSNIPNPIPEPGVLTLIFLGLIAIRRQLFSS